MTTLPTWAVWVLSFGSPAVTAVITAVGQYLSRRAAELAVSGGIHRCSLVRGHCSPRQAIEQAGGDVEVVTTTGLSELEDAAVASEEDEQEEPDI